MLKPVAMFFWRRLDAPGHDSCRLFRLARGWRLEGAAVFRDAGEPCHLQYQVSASAAWKTQSADVAGHIGRRRIDIAIRSAGDGRWRLNGVLKKGVSGCVDIDLGFTPATNQIAVRRLALRVGERAEAPAAYLAFPDMRLSVLPQTYRRIGRDEYAYEAPTAGYAGTLRVARSGAIVHYPGLFERVASD